MKRRAFTLAEVLITLTIIGVIATLTFSALKVSTRTTQNKVTLKNTMNIISRVATMNIAKNDWGFEGLAGGCTTTVADAKKLKAETDTTVCGMFNSMLSGEEMLPYEGSNGVYTNGKYSVPTEGNSGVLTSAGYYVSYQLQNGAIVSIARGASGCTEKNNPRLNESAVIYDTECFGFIDVNGRKGPNRAIACADGTRTHLWEARDGVLNECAITPNDDSDIFPFRFYENTVELASDAARSYLNSSD